MEETTAKEVEFQTIKSEVVNFGKNNFIEIARKKAVSEKGENEFCSISRGFVTANGQKRFKTSISIPVDVVKKVVDYLGQMEKVE